MLSLPKPCKRKRNSNTYNAKLNFFREEALGLFDICSCRSKDLRNCKCLKDRKVSTKEVTFLNDQRIKLQKKFIG